MLNRRLQPPPVEQEISDLRHWIHEHGCTLKIPNQVYFKGKHIGTINRVSKKLVFIPSITWEEWEAIDKKHPNTQVDIGI